MSSTESHVCAETKYFRFEEISLFLFLSHLDRGLKTKNSCYCSVSKTKLYSVENYEAFESVNNLASQLSLIKLCFDNDLVSFIWEDIVKTEISLSLSRYINDLIFI